MMFFLAKFTRVHLQLVDDGPILISHEAEMMVVHLRLLQVLDQLFILEVVDNRILQGFYLVIGSFPGQKLKSQQERLLDVHHLYPIYDHVIEIAVSALGGKTDFPLSQYQEIVIIVDPPDGLFRVADTHLYTLGKCIKSFVYQVPEESKVIKYASVTLFQVLLLQVRRKFLQEVIFLFQVEFLADIDTLLNVMIDLLFEFIGNLVLIGQLLEGFIVFALLNILRPDVADQGEAHDTEDLDCYQAKCLLIGGSCDIPESDGQHDSGTPIVRPDVSLEPGGVFYALYRQPARLVGLYIAHSAEDDGQHVREAEIEENNLDQGPILLIVIVFDEKCLQFLHFLEALWQLSNDEQSDVLHFRQRSLAVNKKDEKADGIDHHVGLKVVNQDLFVGYQFFTRVGLDSDTVINHFDEIKGQTEVLKGPDESSMLYLGKDYGQCVREEEAGDLQNAQCCDDMVETFIDPKAFLLQKGLLLLHFVPLVVYHGRFTVVSLQLINEFRTDVANFLSFDYFFQFILFFPSSLGFAFLGLQMTGHIPSQVNQAIILVLFQAFGLAGGFELFLGRFRGLLEGQHVDAGLFLLHCFQLVTEESFRCA